MLRLGELCVSKLAVLYNNKKRLNKLVALDNKISNKSGLLWAFLWEGVFFFGGSLYSEFGNLLSCPSIL